MDHRDCLGQLDQLGYRVCQEPQDPRVRRVTMVNEDYQDPLDPLVRQDLLEARELRDCLDPLDLMDNREKREHQDNREHRDLLARMESMLVNTLASVVSLIFL